MYKKFYATTMICLLLLCSGINSIKSQDLKKSPWEVAQLITADLLSRPDFMMYQTPGVMAYGAIKFAGLSKDQKTMADLINRYKRVTDENVINTANHVDANVFGILPLEIFIQTKDKKLLAQGLAFADGQWENPLPDGLTSQTRYWIDDIYMIGCLQVQAFRSTGNMIYLDRAAFEIDSYIQKLQQPNGLFFHGSDAPFFWGRGNGWVAAGFAELLSVLPENNSHYLSILNAYKKMMKTLLNNQSEDGMWRQLIDKPESFKEASSTAMFGFAMSVGVKRGILPKEPYTASFVKAWNTLTEYLDENGKVREVCVGTGQSSDINYYLSRPRTTGDLHGQASILWFACSIISKNYK
jgi:unsaturated rhamnogalacturonyl hydrolase